MGLTLRFVVGFRLFQKVDDCHQLAVFKRTAGSSYPSVRVSSAERLNGFHWDLLLWARTERYQANLISVLIGPL